MVFLGTTFCGGRNTLDAPPIRVHDILAIQIFDGTYNHLYLSSNPNLDVSCFDSEWDYDTKMNAPFNGSLEAGNSSFTLKTTDTVVIRRREVGQSDWITIFVKEINASEDFKFTLRDTYARSGVEYEYSISSYINNVENSTVIKNVYSEFDGYYITDKDCLYGTIFDIDGCDTSRNITTQTLELLNSKYMNVVSNSAANYDSGSITGTFFKFNEDCSDINLQASAQYRNDFKNRLANKKPLILKIWDGRIWMIRVTGNINDAQNGHHDVRSISFDWVEVGDVNDMKTLYNTGLSDIGSRWW